MPAKAYAHSTTKAPGHGKRAKPRASLLELTTYCQLEIIDYRSITLRTEPSLILTMLRPRTLPATRRPDVSKRTVGTDAG